jgi:DNA replication licensing factor MCM5
MKGKEKSNVGTRQPYVRALGIRIDTDGVGRSSAQTLTTAEEEEFVRFSHTPDVYDIIASSIAPSIYGFHDIKKAVACLLFGGSRKRFVSSI